MHDDYLIPVFLETHSSKCCHCFCAIETKCPGKFSFIFFFLHGFTVGFDGLKSIHDFATIDTSEFVFLMFSDHVETMITVLDCSEESFHRTVGNLLIIRMLEKTSLESIRNNIDDRMSTRPSTASWRGWSIGRAHSGTQRRTTSPALMPAPPPRAKFTRTSA
jgi:hypothetical protein